MSLARSGRTVLTLALGALGPALTAGCAGDTVEQPPRAASALPSWSYDSTMVFPADRSLARPEDGVALPDGRLIVADQVHGLRRIELDGTSAPFGEMVAAGYLHQPPGRGGGANGVSLEPGGTHLLVSDVLGAAIYRVEVATGATERIYQHRYGINSAVRDSQGAVWFTQSAHNTPEDGEGRMWAAVDFPVPEGALYRIGVTDGRLDPEARLMVDSLQFANGLAIDEANGHLYLAEITGGRVLRFQVDLATGTLGERTVFVDSLGVDNLELDGAGHLWMVSPTVNALVVVNTATGERHVAFQSLSPAQQEQAAEIARRGQAGESILAMLTPDLWAPLPAFITGVILSPGGGPVYLTGLGNALVRLPR